MYNSRIFDILCILESKLSMKSADLLSTCSLTLTFPGKIKGRMLRL